ncbi:MAG: sulfurtransferase TusA family protein [Desulfobaccales bacterium]
MKTMSGVRQRVPSAAAMRVTPMKSDQRLDISGVLIPFSLALFKSTLAQMAAGAVLEICLKDHDTLRDLLIIVERSGDDVLAWEKQGDCYYVWVQKNPGQPVAPSQVPGS